MVEPLRLSALFTNKASLHESNTRTRVHWPPDFDSTEFQWYHRTQKTELDSVSYERTRFGHLSLAVSAHAIEFSGPRASEIFGRAEPPQ